VAASGRSSQFQASGRKWPLQKIASEWLQVALSGRSICFQASGRKWPQVAAFGQINFHPQSDPLKIHDISLKIDDS
jgi:endonuclease YncB( thermonuclease family)